MLKLPHTDASPLHPVMLHVTPRLLGSFATVAVKAWVPLVKRLALGGTTETETSEGAIGGLWSQPLNMKESNKAWYAKPERRKVMNLSVVGRLCRAVGRSRRTTPPCYGRPRAVCSA